jgi:hypothetical protein
MGQMAVPNIPRLGIQRTKTFFGIIFICLGVLYTVPGQKCSSGHFKIPQFRMPDLTSDTVIPSPLHQLSLFFVYIWSNVLQT